MENKGKLAILIMCLCLVITIELNSVLAWEWDNVKSYDAVKQEVTITNALGLGGEIAKIQLKTPIINYVIAGKNRLVAEVEFNVADLSYQDALKSMTYTDLKTGKEIERPLTYKYRQKIGENRIPNYISDCDTERYENGSVKCILTATGYGVQELYEWIPLEKADFSTMKEKTFTIGIFTDVERGDYVDWKPTWYGVEIDDWAVWSEGLSSGLVNYWKLNESSGTVGLDSRGKDLGTANNMTLINAGWKTGLISNSASFDGTGDYMQANISDGYTTAIMYGTNPTFALGFWFNQTASATDALWSIADENSGLLNRFMSIGSTGGMGFFINTVYSNPFGVGNNSLYNWNFVVFQRDGAGRVLVYSNANLVYNGTSAGSFSNYSLRFGANGYISDPDFYTGLIDEAFVYNRTLSPTEISDLYNSRLGLTYTTETTVNDTTAPTVTLNSPASGIANATTAFTFNCSATDNNVTKNITLWIRGIANYTITGTTNGTSFSISRTLGNGIWIYNCSARDPNNNIGWSSNYNKTIETLVPSITANVFTGIKISGIETLNWSINTNNISKIWWEYNTTNVTKSGQTNSSNFTSQYGRYYGYLWMNNTVGSRAVKYISWLGNTAQYRFNNTETSLEIVPSCTVSDGDITSTNVFTKGTEEIINLTCSYEGMKTTIWSFNVSDGDKWFYMEKSRMVLRFVNNTLDQVRLNFSITDIDKTWLVDDYNYSLSLDNMSFGKVLVDFNVKNAINGTNLSQKYEFINDQATYINETLLVLPNLTSLVKIYVKDTDNKIIPDAKVRVYCRQPTYAMRNLTLTNQRLTDGQGLAVIALDGDSRDGINNCKIEIIAEGYISQSRLITAKDNYEDEIFKLGRAETTKKNEVWLMILPVTFNENTTEIYGKYSYTNGQRIQVTTSYRTAQGYSRKELTTMDETDSYGFVFNAGTDWDSSSQNSIIIETWRYQNDVWTNIRNDTITYKTWVNLMDLKDWADSTWAMSVFLILLIVASGVLGYTTKSSTMGATVFFGGLVGNGLILSGWKSWLLMAVGLFYFALAIVRRINKE